MLFAIINNIITREKLNRRDTTLLSCEIIINFMLKKLFEINTSLSQEMLTIMKAKIEERRNKQLVGLIHFLNKPDYVANKSYFSSCPKKQYLKYGEEILERLFTSAESSDIEVIDEENNYCHLINMSIEEELNDLLHTELMSQQRTSIIN